MSTNALPTLEAGLDEALAEIADLELARASTIDSIEYGQTFLMDWSTLSIMTDPHGDPIVVGGQECLVEEVVKMVLTPRFRQAIYSPEYGTDFEDLIGLPRPTVRVQVAAMLTEALLTDDRIIAVENIQLADVADGLQVTFQIRDFTGDLVHVPQVVIRYGN